MSAMTLNLESRELRGGEDGSQQGRYGPLQSPVISDGRFWLVARGLVCKELFLRAGHVQVGKVFLRTQSPLL